MIHNGASSTASSGSGSAFYSGSTEPSKSLDTSALPKLKAGDEYYVLPTSGTLSAGQLFICLDSTAGAAKWQRSAAVVQIFDGPVAGTSGYAAPTLTIPTFCSIHEFEGIGAGAGGGSGGVYASGAAAYGGDGGNGGQWGRVVLTTADIGSNALKLYQYPPGSGGAAQSNNGTAGSNGGNAGKTILNVGNAAVYVWGAGNLGIGGGTAAGSQYAYQGNGSIFGLGGHNIGTNLTGAGAASPGSLKGGAGGAAGGCIDTSDNARAGGTGYSNLDCSTGNNAGGAAGAAGSNGIAPFLTGAYANSGSGPSGGGASTSANGGAGGNGNGPGQGGAGGGAARNGYASGKGGDGSPSRVYMISRP